MENKTLYFYTKPDNTGVSKKKRKRRATIAGVIIDNELHIGKSTCSFKDSFVKSVGRDLARERALKKDSIRVQGLTGQESIIKLFMCLAKGL